MNYSQLASDNLDGREWYPVGTQEIAYLCEREQWDTGTFTDILALTSPRCSVARNVRNAIVYMATGELLANTIQGVRLAVSHWTKTGEIRGPKTLAFRDALLGDRSAVVLDVHMANLFGVPQSAFSRRSVRDQLTSLVRQVADAVGLCPRDAQACLWYAQRRRIGEQPTGYPIAREYANWIAQDKQFPATGTIRQWADWSGCYQPRLWSN